MFRGNVNNENKKEKKFIIFCEITSAVLYFLFPILVYLVCLGDKYIVTMLSYAYFQLYL